MQYQWEPLALAAFLDLRCLYFCPYKDLERKQSIPGSLWISLYCGETNLCEGSKIHYSFGESL